MSDSKERIQLNLRLDGHKELYEAVKIEASRQKTSLNSFVINALKAALGWETDETPSELPIPSLEAILEALAPRLGNTLDDLIEQKLLDQELVQKLADKVAANLGELAA